MYPPSFKSIAFYFIVLPFLSNSLSLPTPVNTRMKSEMFLNQLYFNKHETTEIQVNKICIKLNEIS